MERGSFLHAPVGVPDPSSLSAVLAQPDRPGPVQFGLSNTAADQQRPPPPGLDWPRTIWFPPGGDSDEGSGTGATTIRTATYAGSGDPSEQRLRLKAPAFDFQAPTKRGRRPPAGRVRSDSDPRGREHQHRQPPTQTSPAPPNCAPSGSFLNLREAVRKRLWVWLLWSEVWCVC